MIDINIHFRHYKDEDKTEEQKEQELTSEVDRYYGTAYVEVKKLKSFINTILKDEIFAELCSQCIKAQPTATVKDTIPQMAAQIEKYYARYGLKVKSINLTHVRESFWRSNPTSAFRYIKEQSSWQSEDTPANTSGDTTAPAGGNQPGSTI